MTHNNELPHFDLANHPPSETINMITGLLERITKTNDKLQASNHNPDKRSAYSCFYARSIPSITIHSYLTRILKYCPCTNECFLSLLVYFDRMSRNSSGLRIDSFNIHRLVISGIMVASKFFSDIFFTNTRYAKVGGLPVAELNALELEFLNLNDYNLNVPIEELQQYGDQLLLHWVREEDRRRELQWRRKEVDDDRMVAMQKSLSASTNNSTDSGSDDSKNHHHSIHSEEPKRHHRRSSHRKEECAGSDLFCRQSRSSKLSHEGRATRAHPTYTTSVATRYDYHQFQPSQSFDGLVTPNKSQPQRHSWHIDHNHRLPTPPYSLIHP
ncbi:cyclin-domain-containing protein [Fennellomyces sp. T-0311]|nr:cyclin-domain-containing protein [Fennellomyces sp. T-0311]